MSDSGKSAPKATTLSVLLFVILATFLPAVAIPVGFVTLAGAAIGIGKQSRKVSSHTSSSRPDRRGHLHALVLVVVLLTLIPFFASAVADDNGTGIARLRIFPESESGDPAVDPSYVGDDEDPWLHESWVIVVAGDTASFGMKIRNYHSEPASGVVLRIALNDALLLSSLSLTTVQGDTPNPVTLVTSDFGVGTPMLANGMSWPPHGIYPTDFADYSVGGIGAFDDPDDTVIISVSVVGAFTEGLQVHFDADGMTVVGEGADGSTDSEGEIITNSEQKDTNIRNPNSKDLTVTIPSVTSIVLPAVALVTLYLLTSRRFRKRTN